MRSFLLPAIFCLLSGCAPPHQFVVVTDNVPVSAQLTLNGKSSPMEKRGRAFFGSRNLSDASGSIRVTYADQKVVLCTIGYITNGEQEPHRFSIVNERCHGQ